MKQAGQEGGDGWGGGGGEGERGEREKRWGEERRIGQREERRDQFKAKPILPHSRHYDIEIVPEISV